MADLRKGVRKLVFSSSIDRVATFQEGLSRGWRRQVKLLQLSKMAGKKNIPNIPQPWIGNLILSSLLQSFAT